MRILYCYRHGILGGVVTQLLNRLRGLGGDDSVSTHLLFAKDHGVSRMLENVAPVRFESNARNVRSYVAREAFDAVVVVDTPEFLEALEGLDLRLIIEVHTTYEHGLRYLSDRHWRPDGFIVPSRYSRSLLEGLGYGKSEPIHLLPNSLDPRLFPIARISTTPSRPLLLWVGKLDSHKNWRGFLEVLARVRADGMDAEGWLVGGETAPKSTEEELIDTISQRGLTPFLRWFPRIEYDQMHRVYATVRQSRGGLVVTSRAESFGMVVLEALMCGCPVVASNVGAIPELTEDRRWLTLYEYADFPAAAEAARQMIENGHAEPTGALLEQRTALCERYSLSSMSSRYRTIMQELVDGHETPALTARDGDSTADDLLRAEVDRLRARMPNCDEHPDDTVAYLRSASRILELRSYRLARAVAARKTGLRSWIRVVGEVRRALAKRPRSTSPSRRGEPL